MADTNNNGKTVKEFLLAEHKMFNDFFMEDLHVAEKRIDFFITLSTAVLTFMGVLAGLSKTEILGEFGTTDVMIIAGFLLFALLMIGRVILIRIGYRNVSLERWKVRMAQIREKFRQMTDSEKYLEDYFPFRADHRTYKPKDYQRWGKGGLNELVLIMNTIIATVLLEIILELLNSFAGSANTLWMGIQLGCGLIGFLLAYFMQKNYLSKKTDMWKREGEDTIRYKENADQYEIAKAEQ